VTEPEHGKVGTAKWHRRNGVLPVCEPCLKAEREQMAAYRSDPEWRRRDRESHRAQSHASTKLRRAHWDEYQRYYAEALGEIRSANRNTTSKEQAA
jgi:hypothetical protein